MKLVVIVGSGSGCGKTTVACRILRDIPGLGAVKISPRDEPLRIEWGGGAPGKDTDLFAQAGAAPVARIVGPREQVGEAWEGARGAFAGCRAVLVEGSRGLDFPGERIVVFVGAEGWRRSRPGRNRALVAAADVVIERSAPGAEEELAESVRRFLAGTRGRARREPLGRGGHLQQLVLASSSPRRRRLLRELGVDYSVRVPDVDERPLPGETPGAHVRRLALTKAKAVAGALGRASGARWVLGADTVVVLDGEILGKPRDARHARAMLRRLAGRTHEVMTGVALVPVRGLVQVRRRSPARGLVTPANELVSAAGTTPGCARARSAVVRSRVAMKPFDEDVIRRYVAGGEPLDKAGAYAVQGRGRSLVAAVTGSLSNVVGLPLERLAPLLAACGIAPAAGRP